MSYVKVEINGSNSNESNEGSLQIVRDAIKTLIDASSKGIVEEIQMSIKYKKDEECIDIRVEKYDDNIVIADKNNLEKAENEFEDIANEIKELESYLELFKKIYPEMNVYTFNTFSIDFIRLYNKLFDKEMNDDHPSDEYINNLLCNLHSAYRIRCEESVDASLTKWIITKIN